MLPIGGEAKRKAVEKPLAGWQCVNHGGAEWKLEEGRWGEVRMTKDEGRSSKRMSFLLPTSDFSPLPRTYALARLNHGLHGVRRARPVPGLTRHPASGAPFAVRIPRIPRIRRFQLLRGSPVFVGRVEPQRAQSTRSGRDGRWGEVRRTKDEVRSG